MRFGWFRTVHVGAGVRGEVCAVAVVVGLLAERRLFAGLRDFVRAAGRVEVGADADVLGSNQLDQVIDVVMGSIGLTEHRTAPRSHRTTRASTIK